MEDIALSSPAKETPADQKDVETGAPATAPPLEVDSELKWTSTLETPAGPIGSEDRVGLLSAKESATAPAEESTPRSSGGFLCFSLDFYKPYFDVDTEDVTSRVLRSCYPFTEHSFFEVVGDKPDLYGPFWICSTLVFVLAVSSNVASWLNASKDASVKWHYDFTLMTGAAGTIFGFASIVPLMLWILMKYLAVPLSLTKLLCLYGYSIVLFIPAALLCLTPSAVVDWIAIVLAASASAGLLLVNSYPLVAEHAGPSAKRVALAMGCVQLTFGLVLKLYFFSRL